MGAVVVHEGRVLLVCRGSEPLKGHWTLPGGLLELGETVIEGVAREVREETGLVVEPMELVELVDRIHRETGRVRYHYVIADYLCRVTGGELRAASDAEAVRWIERAEWIEPAEGFSHPPQQTCALDPLTARVIEKAWQMSQALQAERS